MGLPLGALLALAIAGVTLCIFTSWRWLRSFGSGRERSPTEWALILGVPLLGAAAYWPFAHDGLLGAGDYYHYTLQIADAVTQTRAGHWPVMVGQSPYAFNGNVHTVRTAPYLTHVAALIDLITAHQLQYWQLANLIVLGSGALGAWMTYVCARWIAPDARLVAAAVALLYEFSPAIGTPLMAQDMLATFAATPWFPLVCAACVQCWRQPTTATPWLLLGFSLGLAWMAHPPTAIWITPVVGIAVLLAVLANPLRATFIQAAKGGALLLPVIGYVFYSVMSLKIPGMTEVSTDSSGTILTIIAEAWSGSWKPLDMENPSMGNIQLGYSLWLIVAATPVILLLRRSIPSAWFLFGSLVVLLGCVAPIPIWSEFFWTHVPNTVTAITNVWPMQRIYPVLAALACVGFISAINVLKFQRGPFTWTVFAVLFLACCWSTKEFSKLQHHAAKVRQPRGPTEATYLPGSLVLTRSSYALFGSLPVYFSHGWMSPESESRLLKPSGEFDLDDASFVQAAAAKRGDKGIPIPVGQAFTLQVDSKSDYLFVFTFPLPTVTGEVTLLGQGIRRIFTLPLSGGSASFGAGESSNHTVRLEADKPSPLTLVANAPSGTSISALHFERASLPIRVTSLSPYNATVHAAAPAFLETPLVYIPGYAAKVNGEAVRPARSPEGMVAIPLTPGTARVELTYPGPPGLKALGWAATAALLLGGIVLTVAPRSSDVDRFCRESDALSGPGSYLFAGSISRSRICVASSLLAMACAAAWIGTEAFRPIDPAGRVDLAIQLAPHPPAFAEPLVVTGRKGAADTLYIVREQNSVRFGIDHWGLGGPLSDPIPIALTQQLVVRYESPALRFDQKPSNPSRVRLLVEGKVILDQELPVYAANREEFYVGRNGVDAGVCGPRFSGRLRRLPVNE